MRKFLKNTISGIVSLVLMGSASTSGVSARNIGDVIGKVLSTDIVTYVDGVKIPSYNINGRTAIVAQDLNNLGTGVNFGVSFDEGTRVLTLTDKDIYGTGNSTALVYAENTANLPVGTPVDNVLYTDITANFEGEPLESFNISGYTCIYTDDLAKLCGTYIWDEEARMVNIWRKGSYVPYASKHESTRILDTKGTVATKTASINRWGEEAPSNLVRNINGTFTAVEVSENVNLETYDADFNRISSVAIKKELPLFGGFYSGKEYNYLVFGQENLWEDDSREVIRIVVYSKSFGKIREISVNNCRTAIPFDASRGDIYENDRYLILHTSRSQYAEPDGSRPQTQLTVIVDKTDWQVCNDLGKFQENHTSHSFREFVRTDNGRIITANYSDAAPVRGAFLQELDSEGNVLYTQSIFNVGGPAGANCTGAMTGGFEVSEKGYLVSLSTIEHSLATGYSNVNIEGMAEETRNVYLLWTDKETLAQLHSCIAYYTGTGYSAGVPYLVKLADGRFMVLWQRFGPAEEESNTVCYAFADGEGKVVSPVYTVSAKLSESCRPIETDGAVIWYVNTQWGRDFYRINTLMPRKTVEEINTENKQDREETNTQDKEENKNTEVDGL